MLVLLVILLIVIAAAIWMRKWNNPFLCVMVFGKKGSGKTTLLVRRMTEYHKKGYSVYTTIPDVVLPFVVHISHEDIGKYVGKPKSLLCLDEAGTYFDARKFKTFRDEVSDYFRFQRHYKNVVYLASQSFDVDKRIRSLVDKFYLCGKVGPISYAREIQRKIVLTEPMGDTESRIADQLKFVPLSVVVTWIPKYARYFKSFSPPYKPFFVGEPLLEDEPAAVRGHLRHVLRAKSGVSRKPLCSENMTCSSGSAKAIEDEGDE